MSSSQGVEDESKEVLIDPLQNEDSLQGIAQGIVDESKEALIEPVPNEEDGKSIAEEAATNLPPKNEEGGKTNAVDLTSVNVLADLEAKKDVEPFLAG